MNTKSHWTKCLGVVAIATASLLSMAAQPPSTAPASDAPDQTDAPVDRQKILDLCDKGNFLAALPGLKALAKENPGDNHVAEYLAMALLMTSHEGSDVKEQAAKRVEAREVLLNAQKHGDKSNLLTVLLDKLPEDGSVEPFSPRKEVNDAMVLGELEFAQGHLEKAIEYYQKAYQLDPKLYEAALFTGDMYFRLKKQTDAGVWFANAVKIDPDRETAHRYWGDALMQDGKPAEARDKFIDALIAEPYGQAARIGLKQWAQKTGVTLTLMRWKPVGEDDDNKTEAAASKAYAATRATWKAEKFQQQFPKAKSYHHSLSEEADALNSAIAVFEKTAPADQGDLSDEAQNLLRAKKAGLLEPYVLLVTPDQGIADDYAKFREVDRAKLRQFIEQFIVGETAEKK